MTSLVRTFRHPLRTRRARRTQNEFADCSGMATITKALASEMETKILEVTKQMQYGDAQMRNAAKDLKSDLKNWPIVKSRYVQPGTVYVANDDFKWQTDTNFDWYDNSLTFGDSTQTTVLPPSNPSFQQWHLQQTQSATTNTNITNPIGYQISAQSQPIGLNNPGVQQPQSPKTNQGAQTLTSSVPKAFNPYVNASDRLEEFIAYLGTEGVRSSEVMGMPLELFIKWLVIEACKADDEPVPEGVVVALPRPSQPRCLGCQRFMRKGVVLPLHDGRCADKYFARHGALAA